MIKANELRGSYKSGVAPDQRVGWYPHVIRN